MTIGIVDYGLGNLTSVEAAVRRLGCEAVVSSDPAELAKADKLILPGVGAFGDGMRNLRERGLVEPLTEMVKGDGKPILGICLGFQLIAQRERGVRPSRGARLGRRRGGAACAGGRRAARAACRLERPHPRRPLRISTTGLPDDALFYYVHSFRLAPVKSEIVIGECDYGGRFAAAIRQDNIWAVQFHPEKSQQSGLRLLKNFLEHGTA